MSRRGGGNEVAGVTQPLAKIKLAGEWFLSQTFPFMSKGEWRHVIRMSVGVWDIGDEWEEA